MSYHPRIECESIASLQTSRTRNSALWFANCPQLEEAILGYAARYTTRYEVKLYALAIEGNHIHQLSLCPNANRAHYMRDFNSSVARAVPRYQPTYPGGPLWARRYSNEYLVADEDSEEKFFYVVLQPVNDGLVDDIRDYPGYNCFEDAISGRERLVKVVRWKEYNDKRRWNPAVSVEDFTDLYILQYSRLPGYDHLSQAEYAAMMRKKLAEHTAEVVKAREGKPSMGVERLKEVEPGSLPHTTKTSGPNDHRPRVLSKDPKRRSAGEEWYFSIYFQYREASKLYRSGVLDVEFPKGTYKPPLFTVAYTGQIPAL